MTVQRHITRDQAIRADRAAARATTRARRGLWPVPGTRAEDRARILANALLAAVESGDDLAAVKAAAAEIRTRAHRFGEAWLGAAPAAESRWLTRAQAAALAGVQPDTVSQWTSRGIRRAGEHLVLTRHPDGYLERDVHDFLAALRTGAPSTAHDDPKE